MTFTRFEEVEAWQTARALARAIYSATKEGPFRRDFGLSGQMCRAVVSMMANVAEGVHSRSDKEFTRYLFTAKASAAELQSHLYVAFDQEYLPDQAFKDLFGQTDRFSRQVSGLITYLTTPKPTKRKAS